jgi:hypothetical protein
MDRQQLAEALKMSDNMAREHSDFIRKHAPLDDTVSRKENANALVAAAEPERHWIDNDELVHTMGHVVAELRQEFAGTNQRKHVSKSLRGRWRSYAASFQHSLGSPPLPSRSRSRG